MLSTTFILYFIVLSTTTTLINSNGGGPSMVEGRYLPTRSNTNSLDRLRDLLRNVNIFFRIKFKVFIHYP